MGGSFCEMSVSWSPKSGRVEILDVSPKRRAGFGPDKLENGPDFLRRMALKAPWIRDIQGKGRFALKLSDVGSFDGISTGISDDFPGRRCGAKFRLR